MLHEMYLVRAHNKMPVTIREWEQLCTSIHERSGKPVKQIRVLHRVPRTPVQMVPLQERKADSNNLRRRVLYLRIPSNCIPCLYFRAE